MRNTFIMSKENEILSPFLFGKTVVENEFINRTSEIKHLWLNLRSGINTVLISPRRLGKSSLVRQTYILNQNVRDVKWCFIDMFSIRNEQAFYEKFCAELLKATSNKWNDLQKNIKKFFKAVVPQITVSADDLKSLKFGFQWNDIERNKEEILNLPETIAQKLGIKLIVCLDEFQNIANFSQAEDFEKELRSYWQHHNSVSYCIYGSKKTMMTEIFNLKNRAFYRFGDIMLLDRIATEHWQEFIMKKFAETGKTISSEQAKLIAEKMKNHPYYVQQFSHYVWENTANEVDNNTIEYALIRMLDANIALYQMEFDGLSNTQIELLKAIINGETQYTSVKVMRNYGVGTPQNISKNIKALENKDIISRSGKCIEILDPAFELWLKTVI